MIIREEYMTRSDGVKLFRTYSDGGKQILQVETGSVYDEAIDVESAPYTYEEYEEPESVYPEAADPEDMNPEVSDDIADASEILTRAELTAKVTALEEQNAVLMECLLEMSEAVYA